MSGPELLMVAALLVVAGVALSSLPAAEPDQGPSLDASLDRDASPDRDSRPWVAVLPFKNLGGQQEDVWFTDGIHGQIITQLHKIGGLAVTSQMSVEEYRGQAKNLRIIGRELGVDYIAEGDVLRVDDVVRVNVQLIDSETDDHVWADAFDRPYSLDNVLSLQTEIARQVAQAVEATVTPQEIEALGEAPTDNLEAYELYQEGLALIREGDNTSFELGEPIFREAVELLSEAVRLDPAFGLAYAKLSYAHLSIWYSGVDMSQARLDLAQHALDQAMALAPNAGETFLSLGYVRYWGHRDYEGAIAAFEGARERLPGDSEPLEAIGYVKRRLGQYEEVARILEEAFRLNPRSVSLAVNLSPTYKAMRRHEEAAQWAQRAIDLGGGPFAVSMGAGAHLRQGTLEGARSFLAQASDSTHAMVIAAGFWVEAFARDYEAAAAWVARSPDPIVQVERSLTPVAFYLGLLHHWKGEEDQARVSFQAAATQYRVVEREGTELAVALAALGQREEALALIDSIAREWTAVPDAYLHPVPFEDMAVVRVFLGDHDEAVGILEEMMELETAQALTVADLSLNPTWDPLRDHPHFQALLEEYADDVES